MYTEEEAKKRWCAHSRTGGVMAGTVMPAANRLLIGLSDDGEPVWEQNPAACTCLASRCMAWRWEPMSEMLPRDSSAGIPIDEHPRADVRYFGINSGRRVDVPKGYCGLAGKP